jgi:hypothetical protein
MEVSSRGVEAAMAEQDLDGPQVDAVLKQVGGEAVPEGVNRDVLVQLCAAARLLASFIHGLVSQRMIRDISREQPGTGLVDPAPPMSFPVFPQQSQ